MGRWSRPPSSKYSPKRCSISSQSNPRPIFCLFGPTASGKTDLLDRLFASGRAEVISADSMQVYRGMDIGTAKPEAALCARLPHHLIDIKEPSQSYHVGEFVSAVEPLLDQILARGRLPIISGGTAFYLRTLLCGLPEAPAADDAVREDVRQRLQSEGRASLYAELQRVDPQSAACIDAADEYRIARALEIYQTSGRPRSEFARPSAVRGDLDPVIVALDRPRDELYARINLRVHRMFEDGLVEEVTRLVEAGHGADAPGMRAIGYAEFLHHPRVLAEGIGAVNDPAVQTEIESLIARNSRRYAKRQLTFFRRVPGVRWVSADDVHSLRTAADEAIDRVTRYRSGRALDSGGSFSVD
ncbi:MAG: tRNA (adenosine(37)-N6)-dimethylallyltransferase MiaA [Spirochaetaceae bacterium]|nr:MAG: tRNA (adenosine(37)-N6)-dimethylallyltransferase MiaA [Spirochaetaceae bacterium]